MFYRVKIHEYLISRNIINTHNYHSNRWPDYDCCSYQNTFSQETTLDPMTHLPISVYYHHNQLVDYCSVINVFSGHVDNLLPTPPHNKPVVILFWTEW